MSKEDKKNDPHSKSILSDTDISNTSTLRSCITRSASKPDSKTSSARSKTKNLQSAGPFQIIDCPATEVSTISDLDHPPQGPQRRYDCSNYETCLNLAAALNWDNFTCLECCGEVNDNLLWRAQHEVRKDQMAKAICDLPDARDRKIENAAVTNGLRLVGEK